MTVRELVKSLDLEVLAGDDHLDTAVTGACVCDLLSFVMSKAGTGNVWVTIQVHPNIVGVAELLELAAVVLAHGQQPEPATLARAQERGIALLASKDSAFALAGKLYELGVR